METNTKPTEEVEEMKVEVMNADTLSTIIKAEIDMQITTAKAYPRSIDKFLKRCETLATVSTNIAESCSYALPRRQQNQQGGWENKNLTGPSVRLAEIVIASYGNIRAGARVISNDGRFITAQGICHDLETNVFVSVEVKRKITNKAGKTFTEDMQAVTGNAACAIAFRNAVFKVIPAALLIDVYEKIKEVAKGTSATLIDRRNKALKFFHDKNVKDEQICEALEILSVNDIDLDKLAILSGMKAAIVNEESRIDELFPVDENRNVNKANGAKDETIDMMKPLKKKDEKKEDEKKQ